jgi:hypothetical protein
VTGAVPGRRAHAALGLLVALLLAAGPGRAEIVPSQGEGSAPIPGAGAAGTTPTQAALQAALADAVEAVAARLAGRPADAAAQAALRSALGPDPARFAQGFREVERSERPGPAGRALVVRVEARVDAGAVREALRAAGLLAPRAAPAAGTGGGSHLVIEPLPAWPLLAAVEKRLVELGARRVTPERAEPASVVLSIDSDRSSGRLVEELIASPPPGVSVVPVGDHEGAPAVRLEARPTSLPAD